MNIKKLIQLICLIKYKFDLDDTQIDKNIYFFKTLKISG